ncbi:NHLP bacteriocin export ABC transporter permease/ATPase subunit [Fusibacter paucivorans]|uniref:NHLP bacteriocin export ABC transporter permease/ATPase subunit n=1 Tax=Fusibacter paucivorans TaxID=76009 RepID=A0ABS5PK34_9FIRM|nr:NHLP bacteriocin export ABC transporter permease/ATPase subunit [Fusibacter paucivorans]MBS7525363.1 NHLP bacteriocin export ABC transporter permease/ATPase subunit [Fusibacter paucivorans]
MALNPFEKTRKNKMRREQMAFAGAIGELMAIINDRSDSAISHFEESQTSNAVRIILKYFHIEAPDVLVSFESIDELLAYYLGPSGIMKRRVELTGKWWRETTGPILASDMSGEAVALMPTGFGGYRFYHSEMEKIVRVNAGNAALFDVDAFTFYAALPNKSLKIIDLIRFMLSQLNASDIVLLLLMCLSVSLLGLFTPFVNQQVFNNIIPSGTKGDVAPIAILLAGAAFGTACFQMSRNMILMRLKEKVVIAVQSATMARLYALPTSFFKKYAAGEMSKRVMSINEMSIKLSDTVLSSLLTALFAIVYIFQMAYFAPMLMPTAIGVLFWMFAFSIWIGMLQQRLLKKRLKASAKLEGMVFGLFSGVQKIKLAGAEKRAFSKWASQYRVQGTLDFAPPMILRIQKALSGMLVLAGTIAIYYKSAVEGVSVSNFIAFQVSYGIVSSAIMALANAAMTLASIKPLMDMVEPILEAVPEVNAQKIQVTSLSGKIELSNVSFKYDTDGPTILKNIQLQVQPGEYMAIVGGSGSGKSTLMRLLLGFELPTAGAVYYDDNDLSSLDIQSVRRQIGTCLQDGKLFAGELFSNIIVSAPWATLEDAWAAAEMAGLADDIKAMPMGMNTMISEGSGNVSGGQKQRILIARALITKPNILYFDEATSALDNITQKVVTDQLNALGCTRIVIAHRLSTVKDCDRIVVLEKGEIVEMGTYQSLMAKRGRFYELAIRQIT